MSADLVAFLLARINEDEAIAKEHSGDAPIHYTGCYYYSYSLDANWFCDCKDLGDDPAIRLLAECAAKRAVVEAHGSYEGRAWLSGKALNNLWCGSCGSYDDAPVPYPCDTTKHLAAVYSTHPDYLKEWKP